MDLFYRRLGKGFPIVILHGLYGASDNWLTIAKQISNNNELIIPDIRNHGQSPHDDDMHFDVMVEDIYKLLKNLKIEKCILLGHSMGGKLAMNFALKYPNKLEKLIVVDVAPRSYMSGYSKHFEFHKKVVSKMNALDLSKISSRKDAEQQLIEVAASERVVRFLLKNLKKEKNGSYKWKLNIAAIYRNLHYLIDGVGGVGNEAVIEIPSLFIKGSLSDYITDNDEKEIGNMFPNLTFRTIDGAGHWVHAEKMDEFVKIVSEFV